jgi:CubicO group peptidase (beta-lactamase class C family)
MRIVAEEGCAMWARRWKNRIRKSRTDSSHALAACLICLVIACGIGVNDSQQQTFQNATADDFDVEALESAFGQAREIEDLRSLVVARDFEVLAEVYLSGSGPNPDPEFHVMSVTKSVTATLVGIAIDMGFIECCSRPSDSASTADHDLGSRVARNHGAIGIQ